MIRMNENNQKRRSPWTKNWGHDRELKKEYDNAIKKLEIEKVIKSLKELVRTFFRISETPGCEFGISCVNITQCFFKPPLLSSLFHRPYLFYLIFGEQIRSFIQFINS